MAFVSQLPVFVAGELQTVNGRRWRVSQEVAQQQARSQGVGFVVSGRCTIRSDRGRPRVLRWSVSERDGAGTGKAGRSAAVGDAEAQHARRGGHIRIHRNNFVALCKTPNAENDGWDKLSVQNVHRVVHHAQSPKHSSAALAHLCTQQRGLHVVLSLPLTFSLARISAPAGAAPDASILLPFSA